MSTNKKYKIKLNKYPNAGILRSDGVFSSTYDKDFYITISLYKNITIDDYIDVEIDPLKIEIERQFINPFFIELGFFENITSVLKQNTITNNSIEEKSEKFNIKINK